MHQKIRGASGNQNIQLVVETSTHTIQRRARKFHDKVMQGSLDSLSLVIRTAVARESQCKHGADQYLAADSSDIHDRNVFHVDEFLLLC